MPAAQFDLAVEAGASYPLRLTVRSGSGADAPAMDLAGWTPRMQIRPHAASLDVLLDCRPENGRLTVADAGAGRLQLRLAPADTARFDFDSAVYDLVIDNGSDVRRLLQGSVNVSKAVTR